MELVTRDDLRDQSRSIRKDRRVYFFDCAAAYDETGGAQLENLVACSLLKYAQFRKDADGESWEIFYLRDKESREVDFGNGMSSFSRIRGYDLNLPAVL
jgi:predicted AAA+ superfamily ATPase